MLAGWLGTGAAEAGAPPISVTPSTVAPGESFVAASVADCAETTPSIELRGPLTTPDQNPYEIEPIASETVDASTNWSVEITVPAGAEPGTYKVVATDSECQYINGTLLVEIPQSISLVKTVGTVADACATTTSISVEKGTTVYYCYTVTNNTEITLSTHSLSDDKLGDLLTDVAYDLAPGASANTVALGKTISATPTASTTNVGTWTAEVVEQASFTATASATVTVNGVAVLATPDFTG
jgi:hypothetical protein